MLGRVANLAGWVVVVGLAVGATVFAARLGFVGILILGLMAWLVCSRVAMDEEAPTWGVAVFRARMQGGGSPEDRAAARASRQAFAAALAFYCRCGIVLVLAGLAGLVWQQWR